MCSPQFSALIFAVQMRLCEPVIWDESQTQRKCLDIVLLLSKTGAPPTFKTISLVRVKHKATEIYPLPTSKVQTGRRHHKGQKIRITILVTLVKDTRMLFTTRELRKYVAMNGYHLR